MALVNTFIYPSFCGSASKYFAELIAEPLVIVVVVGQDAAAQKAVVEADRQAAVTYFSVKRQVIWLPDHNTERVRCLQMLNLLPGFDPTKYDSLLAFSIKPISDVAADIIFEKDITDDITLKLRLKRAFAKAGIDQ
jgi:hypothetical protein